LSISEYFNDLWQFDGEEWVWVSGSNTTNQNGTYGEKGVANANNNPGGRYAAVSWMDNSGNMWIFGGEGCDSSGGVGNSFHENNK
jgi:hypothetical protein